MSKSIIILLIVLTALGLEAESLREGYKRPSDDQLLSWWGSLTVEAQIKELRKLDEIENSIPKITIPEMVAVLTRAGDLVIKHSAPIKVKVSYLEYELDFEAQKIENFYKKRKGLKEYFFPIALGLGSGLIGSMMNGKIEPLPLIFSGIQGVGLGFIVSIAM